MGTVYRDTRGRLYLNFADLHGRRQRQPARTDSMKEARQKLRSLEAEIHKAQVLNLPSVDRAKASTFEEFYRDTYLPAVKARVRQSTLDRKTHLEAHVLPALGKLPLRAITAGHVSDFMAKRSRFKPQPSNREINMERGLISAVLNEAFRHGLVDVNEAARVRPLRENARDLWLKPVDVDLVLEWAEPWIVPFITLAVHTGMREGELCALKWEDLDHSPGWIRVGEESKTHRVRFIPVNSATRAVLASQTRRIGPEGSLPTVLVNARRRKAYKPDSICHSFKRAARRARKAAIERKLHDTAARLEEATFHTLRHTFASWLVQAGVPLAEVQQYLGHASDHMTRRYAHLAPASKERRSALEVLAQNVSGASAESCVARPAVVNS